MSLKKFLNKIATFFKNIFEKLEPVLQEAIHKGVEIVEAIKTFDTNKLIFQRNNFNLLHQHFPIAQMLNKVCHHPLRR